MLPKLKVKGRSHMSSGSQSATQNQRGEKQSLKASESSPPRANPFNHPSRQNRPLTGEKFETQPIKQGTSVANKSGPVLPQQDNRVIDALSSEAGIRMAQIFSACLKTGYSLDITFYIFSKHAASSSAVGLDDCCRSLPTEVFYSILVLQYRARKELTPTAQFPHRQCDLSQEVSAWIILGILTPVVKEGAERANLEGEREKKKQVEREPHRLSGPAVCPEQGDKLEIQSDCSGPRVWSMCGGWRISDLSALCAKHLSSSCEELFFPLFLTGIFFTAICACGLSSFHCTS